VSQFKITSAVQIVTPGATGPEMVATAPVPLTWSSYSSANTYHVRVYDALGTSQLDMTVPKTTTTVNFPGPLVSGMYYQFFVTAIDNGGAAISNTENLKGVFFAP
jgi:hypothetical protein